MTDISNFTPEDRVRLIVSGRFTADTFGPDAYRAINRAVVDDADVHLDAFQRIYLSPRPTRRAIGELYLPHFLQLVRQAAPQRVETLAKQLDDLMASLARHQASEAESLAESSDAAVDEIARQRNQLARRREVLADILRPG